MSGARAAAGGRGPMAQEMQRLPDHSGGGGGGRWGVRRRAVAQGAAIRVRGSATLARAEGSPSRCHRVEGGSTDRGGEGRGRGSRGERGRGGRGWQPMRRPPRLPLSGFRGTLDLLLPDLTCDDLLPARRLLCVEGVSN
ncbi:hypothetical protein PAHAL_5G065900 [Panicum hallii]|uniref:Uncharacterized protein n=1 Tax=Panicum hallii TaxID=206008 RepID=A0A2T8IJ67_9POAL|nr:hypothetical protein PAHAL_5G065900 [Panicum hallii]